MAMDQELVKAVTTDNNFRVLLLNGQSVVETARLSHHLTKTTTTVLGRGLLATLLLASSVLKGTEGLTVRLNGQGPVGGMLIDADAHGTVKGYLQHGQVELPLLANGDVDVASAVGTDGFLEVLKTQGNLDPYTSTVPLVTGQIGSDFAYYLAKSEQINSAVGVSVVLDEHGQVKTAGGYLIQTLPDADNTAIAALEERLPTLPSIATMLTTATDPVKLAAMLLPDEPVKVLSQEQVAFACDCSKAQFAQSLAGLSSSELRQLITEDHGAEVVCHFCGARYQFSATELQQILAEKGKL
ncbi:Hsp33 family molecular chaperone HslO [Fructilactobacillus florum]|uniref:33 kDa chaperonin n=1 Tax=Fructilactobacillus florum DSM 22689 = JCM 16035 TaxID=1423745 RepID=A0A0R2CE12_9LACO|nr:Hsp33 family molecular chaperone HslO [Fructilactobacillus florum]EKK20979.1 Chaperonin (heat shock protein 33) [Fructilactobacillus florum 2F]KRM90014.1 heat shock protein 33 [Fructilactobacillus florum DSM 22689 = JCM 16035]